MYEMNAIKYYERKYPYYIAELKSIFDDCALSDAKMFNGRLAILKNDCYFINKKSLYKKGRLVFIISLSTKEWSNCNAFTKAHEEVNAISGYHMFYISRIDYKLVATLTKKQRIFV